MYKGQMCRVAEVRNEGNSQLIITSDGSVLAIAKTSALTPGMEFSVGPVCGEWCFLDWENQRLRARVLRTGVANDTHAQADI